MARKRSPKAFGTSLRKRRRKDKRTDCASRWKRLPQSRIFADGHTVERSKRESYEGIDGLTGHRGAHGFLRSGACNEPEVLGTNDAVLPFTGGQILLFVLIGVGAVGAGTLVLRSIGSRRGSADPA